MQKPTLVAVDTNVVLLLAADDEHTADAWETIRRKVSLVQFLVPPTVIQELTFKAHFDNDIEEREVAAKALVGLRSRWRFQPAVLNDVQGQIARHADELIRERGLLPFDERNDALIHSGRNGLPQLCLVGHARCSSSWNRLSSYHFSLPFPRPDSACNRGSFGSDQEVLLLTICFGPTHSFPHSKKRPLMPRSSPTNCCCGPA